MADLDRSRRRAAGDVSRHCRLNGVVMLLDALARETRLRPEDHELYFMAWQVTRLLRPAPGDLTTGWTSPGVPVP